MKKLHQLSLSIVSLATVVCCSTGRKAKSVTVSAAVQSTDSVFYRVQYNTFQYFWQGAEPNSGLARERIHMDDVYPQNDKNIVTTGGSGFGVMAILVGIERGFITRQQGFKRFERIINFLEKADRFHGAWPHWINGETGGVKPFGQKDNGATWLSRRFCYRGF